MVFQFLKVLWYYLRAIYHPVYKYAYIHVCMYVCIYVSMYLCIYVCIDVYMYDYIYSINSIIQCYKQYYSAIPARNISELSLLLFKF